MIRSLLVFILLSQVVAAFDLRLKEEVPEDIQAPVKCETSEYPPDPSRKVPGFVVVDLDESPLTRWRNVVVPRKAAMKKMIDDVIAFALSIFKQRGHLIIDIIESKGPEAVETLPDPVRSEIKGIAELTGVSVGRVAMFNMFYEFFTVCTSIVAEDGNGKQYHARNLDFGLLLGWDISNNTWALTEDLRPLVVNVQWNRGGKPLFYSVQLAGYVGVLTAMKPQAFSLTINDRFEMNGGFLGIIEWFMGMHKQDWNMIITRRAFEELTTYTDARTFLSNEKLLAPVYFILGGSKPGDGCVISRARGGADDVWEMSSITEHKWYILQTNYDHWKKPPFFDNRRGPGEYCVEQSGQRGVSKSSLFNVLSTRPVLNKLTLYGVLMRVETGELESYQMYCPDPCPLW